MPDVLGVQTTLHACTDYIDVLCLIGNQQCIPKLGTHIFVVTALL